MALINICNDLFSSDYETINVNTGILLEDFIKDYVSQKDDLVTQEVYNIKTGETEYIAKACDNYKTVVMLNGEELEDYNYYIKNEDIINIIFIPQSEEDEDTAKIWSNILAATAMGVGGLLVATGWGAAAGMWMIGLGAAHMGANAIWEASDAYWDSRAIPTDDGYKSETKLEAEANLSLSGGKNQPILNHRFPIIIGKTLLNPMIMGSPYSSFTTKSMAGNDDGQYLTILYCLGYRPLRITDVKIGDITVAYNRAIEGISKSENDTNIYHGVLNGVAKGIYDDGDILRKWKNNDLSLEIIQNGKDFSTLYPQVVEEIYPDANIIKIEDEIIQEVASTHYKGVAIPDGYQTNTVRFSHSCPYRLEVDIEFPDGLYATRTKKEDKISKILYYGLPVNMAIQWRFVYKGQKSSDPKDFSDWFNFSKIEIQNTEEFDLTEYCYPRKYTLNERVFQCNSNLGKTNHTLNFLEEENYEVINNDSALDKDFFIFGDDNSVSRGTIPSKNLRTALYKNVTYKWVVIQDFLGHTPKEIDFSPDGGWIGNFVVGREMQNIYAVKEKNGEYYGAILKENPFSDNLYFAWRTVTFETFQRISESRPNWDLTGSINDDVYIEKIENSTGSKTEVFYYAGLKGSLLNVTKKSIFSKFANDAEGWTQADDEVLKEGYGYSLKEMISPRRYTVSYDFNESDVRELLTNPDVEMDSVEVRVIRITPNYLDETGDQEGDYSNVHYQDMSKWTRLRTFVFDKEKVMELIKNEESFNPADYPLRPMWEKDLDKFTFLALKLKQDIAQTGGSQLNQLSCIAQNYVPSYDKNINSWVPNTIGYNNEKKRTDIVDYFDNHAVLDVNKNRYYMPQEYIDKHAISNTASQWVNLLTNSYLGSDAKTYDNIDMKSLTEFYNFCEDVTDGTPYDKSTGYEDKGDRLLHIKFECNGVISNNQKVENILQQIALTGRATIGRNELGKYKVYIGKPVDYPIAVLNQRNIISASNTKTFEPCPSGYEMSFIDESDNYTQNTIYAMDDREKLEAPSKETEQLSYSFVTNKYQLLSLGRFNLATRKFQVELYKRTVGPIGHTFSIGDRILLQDSSLLVGTDNGARVAELIEDDKYIYGFIADDAYTYTGEVDENGLCKEGITIMQAGLYNESRCVTLRFATPEGVVTDSGNTLKTVIGLTNKIILANPIIKDSNTSADHITASDYCTLKPEIGDLLAFGQIGMITRDAQIVSIEPQDNDNFDLTLVPYIDAVYNYGRKLPVFSSNITKPSYAEIQPDFSNKLTAEQVLTESSNKANQLEKEIEKQINDALSDIGVDTRIGDITSADAILEEHQIQIKLNIDYDNFIGTIKDFIYELSMDNGVTFNEIKRVNSDIYNYPLPSIHRYKEKDYFTNWKLRVKAQSQYDTYSENWFEFDIDTSNYGTWIPPKFDYDQVIAIANEQGINVNLNNKFPSDVKLYGSYNTIVEFSRDGEEWIEVKDNYIPFDRNIDGYPEKEQIEQYKIRVYRKSYLVDHPLMYTEKYVDATGYGTWIPPVFAVSQIDAVATEQGIDVSVDSRLPNDTKYYGSYSTIIEYTRDGIDWNIADGEFIYFDRDVDGYPEKSQLENYKVRVTRKSLVIDHELIYTEQYIDTSSYSTWLPLTPNIRTSISGRTININIEQPVRADGLRPYGIIKYKVQVKRITPVEDSEYNCPSLSLNPYDSEDNYKDVNSAKDYVLVDNNHRQTMPLSGQNATEPLPVDTMYRFKITAINVVTDVEAEPLETPNLTALATSVKDIVAGAITTTKLADGCVTVDKIAVDTLVADESFMNELTAGIVNTGELSAEQISVYDFGYISGNNDNLKYKYLDKNGNEQTLTVRRKELFFGNRGYSDFSAEGIDKSDFIKMYEGATGKQLDISVSRFKASYQNPNNLDLFYKFVLSQGSLDADIHMFKLNIHSVTNMGVGGLIKSDCAFTIRTAKDYILHLNSTTEDGEVWLPNAIFSRVTGNSFIANMMLQNCILEGTLTAPNDVEISAGNISPLSVKLSDLLWHLKDTENPHKVVKADIGLDKVNNTADSEKRVAYAEKAGSLDNMSQLTISSTVDTSLTSWGTEPLSIGAKTGGNLGIDSNEIQARNNTAVSVLYLNTEGGNIEIGKSGYVTTVKGNLSISGTTTMTGALTANGGISTSGTLNATGILKIPYTRPSASVISANPNGLTWIE